MLTLSLALIVETPQGVRQPLMCTTLRELEWLTRKLRSGLLHFVVVRLATGKQVALSVRPGS